MWLFQKTTPESVSEIRAASRLARGPRVVAVGGGNGLAALLRGLKSHTSNLTAVVTMADDGGSSGLLRRDMGMPPPGDLRNCLVALADDESMMSQLFKYRFPERRRPAGSQLRQPLHGRAVRGHRRLRARRTRVDARAQGPRARAAVHARRRGAARAARGRRPRERREHDHRGRAPAAARLAHAGGPARRAAGGRRDRPGGPRRARPGQPLHQRHPQRCWSPQVRRRDRRDARLGRLRVQRHDRAGGDRRLHRRRPPGRAPPARARRHDRRRSSSTTRPCRKRCWRATSASARGRWSSTTSASRALGVKVVRASVATESGVVRHDSERLAQALIRIVR